MAKFSVDTHLFRELGEMLVGRDSTALVELIKNSYDADATEVTIYGENLGSATRGRILISDNGLGMTLETFEKGFLTIASRIKEEGDRRSPYFDRRYTGAKGVGRLAAQKLAWNLWLTSYPNVEHYGKDSDAVEATIDWRKIDQCETLDDDRIDTAIVVDPMQNSEDEGTEIELTNLRGKWTASERTRVIREVTTFQPPEVLLEIPERVCDVKLLFDEPLIRDVGEEDPGFRIKLEGEFDVGDEYWGVVASAADWILEIDSDNDSNSISYLMTPTRSYQKRFPNADQHEFIWEDPLVEYVPSFHSRILIREGAKGIKSQHRQWLASSAGVRIYMEGFRVLPYGDSGDDWLEIDKDYSQRRRTLRFLSDADLDLTKFGDEDDDFGLTALRNSSYFGAVFLTNNGSSELDMLVNREGFLPTSEFMSLQRIVRVGIDLSVRTRAFENADERQQRRETRKESKSTGAKDPERMNIREDAETAAKHAAELAKKARIAASAGDHKTAEQLIKNAGLEIAKSTSLAGELVTDRSIMQVLAGVGLQMAAFVHEMNALLGMASAVEASIQAIRDSRLLDNSSRKRLAKVEQNLADLRRVIERQASYLKDVTSPDSRRRRSRQNLMDRFSAAQRLVQRAADKRKIEIVNKIPSDLKSPPVFPAEITVVFSNLLSNAIKACKRNGKVLAKGRGKPDGTVLITIQNTGKRINLGTAEKWFLPFKSTTIEADPVLGQGMGMGLPIVRNILEEYGATIHFLKPTGNFSTAIEIAFK